MSDTFEEPTGDAAGSEDPYREFSAPETSAAEAVEAEATPLLGVASSSVLAIRDALAETLMSSAAAASQSTSALSFEASSNVRGVGVGLALDASAGSDPGEPSLMVFVNEAVSEQDVRGVLADTVGLSAGEASGVPLQVVVTGAVDAQPHRWRERPAPCGISVAHTRVTAGTIGSLAIGRREPRTNRLLLLSNNHVLANSNNAAFGDAIVQPGPYDGGSSPDDRIAILERFVPISWTSPNYVDCATAWCWPDRVRREKVYVVGGQRRYFRVGSAPVAPQLGMLVGKSGRTTQLTMGRIAAVGVTINVNFGNGRVANFRDQIGILSSTASPFSAGGDSGSLIWTWNGTRSPVGLLFAGGGGWTFANPIGHVLNALDINLVS